MASRPNGSTASPTTPSKYNHTGHNKPEGTPHTMSTETKTYKLAFWTGHTELVDARSAYEAALTRYSEEHLHSYRVADDLLGQDPKDHMIVLSENYETVCVITPDEEE